MCHSTLTQNCFAHSWINQNENYSAKKNLVSYIILIKKDLRSFAALLSTANRSRFNSSKIDIVPTSSSNSILFFWIRMVFLNRHATALITCSKDAFVVSTWLGALKLKKNEWLKMFWLNKNKKLNAYLSMLTYEIWRDSCFRCEAKNSNPKISLTFNMTGNEYHIYP